MEKSGRNQDFSARMPSIQISIKYGKVRLSELPKITADVSLTTHQLNSAQPEAERRSDTGWLRYMEVKFNSHHAGVERFGVHLTVRLTFLK